MCPVSLNCDPVAGAPQQVIHIIQACAWEPSKNFLDVALFQDLLDIMHLHALEI